MRPWYVCHHRRRTVLSESPQGVRGHGGATHSAKVGSWIVANVSASNFHSGKARCLVSQWACRWRRATSPYTSMTPPQRSTCSLNVSCFQIGIEGQRPVFSCRSFLREPKVCSRHLSEKHLNPIE